MAALNPGANATAILDFTDSDDVKFYHKAIKGLDESSKYDLSTDKLRLFLNNVSERSEVFGWTNILRVPAAAANPPATALNVLEHYGTVTMADCTLHANGYMAVPARAAQNSTMLYHFLYSSLTNDALAKITNEMEKYTIRTNKDGLCFLRLVISKAQIDTIGTVETYRRSLRNLHTKIIEYAGNIREFNQYVHTLTNALDSYGQEYPELHFSLLEAYETIEDSQFSMFITVTRFNYTADPTLYDPRTLMNNVENLYNTRIQAGTWSPALPKVNNISDISALMTKVDALAASISNKNSSARMTDAERASKNEWKKMKPKDGEPKTKTFEGRVYHWCPNHNMWTMHTPEQCEGIGYKQSNKKQKNSTTQSMTAEATNKPDKSGVLKVNEALRAYIESTDDSM